jgi:prophage tail gpP-like protein
MSIELRSASERIAKWMSYDIETDLYQPEGQFSLETGERTSLKKGDRLTLWIDGRKDASVIVQTIKRTTSRASHRETISALSWASLLSKASVTDFSGQWPVTLPAIAERVVRGLPFIGKQDFAYLDGSATVKVARKYMEMSPGDTCFEVLKKAANSQGFLFWCAADGTLTFGLPAASGVPLHAIRASMAATDYLEGSVVETIEDMHSSIIVRGDADGEDDISYTMASATNSEMPFKRPLVITWNDGSGPAKKMARMAVANEMAESLTCEYQFAGHAQAGRPWTVGEYVRLEDELNSVKGTYMLTNRHMRLDRAVERTAVRLQRGIRIEAVKAKEDKEDN